MPRKPRNAKPEKAEPRTPKTRKPTAIGKRLNRVKDILGFSSLRAFYDKLSGGVPWKPSYPSVCTYHGGPSWRDPPTEYLARIVEVFPQVNLYWLLTGVGEPMRGHPDTWRAEGREPSTEERLLESLYGEAENALPLPPLGVVEELWVSAALDELLLSHGRAAATWTEGAAREVLYKLHRLWRIPLEMFGRDEWQMSEADLNAYAIAMFQVTIAALPHTRAGRDDALEAMARYTLNREGST